MQRGVVVYLFPYFYSFITSEAICFLLLLSVEVFILKSVLLDFKVIPTEYKVASTHTHKPVLLVHGPRANRQLTPEGGGMGGFVGTSQVWCSEGHPGGRLMLTWIPPVTVILWVIYSVNPHSSSVFVFFVEVVSQEKSDLSAVFSFWYHLLRIKEKMF